MTRGPSTTWFSRRKLAKFGVLGLIAFCVLSVSLSENARTSIVEAARDPLSILQRRSPGAREAGFLAQSKLRLAIAPETDVVGAVPGERLPYTGMGGPLELPVMADAAPLPYALSGEEPGPTGFELPGNATLPGDGGYSGIGGTPLPDNPGGGGVVIPPPTGGGGATIPPDVGPTPPILPPAPPVSFVPEPATWLTLIVGFGAIGAILRRGRGRLPSLRLRRR